MCILRVRGADDIGATLLAVLARYAAALHAVGSKLMIVTDNPRVERQLRVTGSIDLLGEENLYRGTEWVPDRPLPIETRSTGSTPTGPDGAQDAKSGWSARTDSLRPFGSSQSSWRPRTVRSRK